LTLLLAVAAGVHLFWRPSPWVHTFELLMTGVVLLGAIASTIIAPTSLVWPRIITAAGLLAVGEGILVARLAGHQCFVFDVLPDPRYTAFLAAVVGATMVGLLARRVWGRWVAVGLGLCGAVSSGLNAIWWLSAADGQTWLYLVGCFCSALIAINAAAAPMREAFNQGSPGARLWGSPARVVRVVRWMVLVNLPAIPMLLVYAWVQPVVPATRTSAVVLAALLVAGTVLCMARKVVGAWLVAATGLGLLAQTTATAYLGHAAGPQVFFIAGYYVVFWLPAALLSIACGVVLIRPTLELMRRG